MKRSPSTTWPQEAEKKWKQEGSLQIEQSKRPGRSVDVKDEAIKKFIELANNITDEDSIEIAEEKFGIRRCLDQIFDREYVLGSDGEFEFKLKHVLLRFDLKSALDPNELLDLRIKGNAKKRATLIYLMFGPVAKVGIRAAAKVLTEINVLQNYSQLHSHLYDHFHNSGALEATENWVSKTSGPKL